jgi:UDP-N-acetylmuramate--alanine ligase
VFVTDVYAAGERAIPGVDGSLVAAALTHHGHTAVEYVPQRADLARRAAETARPGDIVLTLGAGDVNKACDELLRRLAARRTNGPEVVA